MPVSRKTAVGRGPTDCRGTLRTHPHRPGIVYHYTRLEAFRSILSLGEIWLTDTRRLNDISEWKVGLGLIGDQIEQGNLGLTPEQTQFWRQSLSLLCGGSYQLFVASFSEWADDISQWRSYGDFAIGFSAQEFGADLEPCFYSDEDHRTELERFLAAELPSWEMRFEEAQTAGELGAQVALPGRLGRFAARLKHSGFEPEREWRLIDGPTLPDAFAPKGCEPTPPGTLGPGIAGTVDYRGAFVAYRKVNVKASIHEVYLGPGQGHLERDLKRFCRWAGYGDLPVHVSQIPLRGR
jgi:hypothetical protein